MYTFATGAIHERTVAARFCIFTAICMLALGSRVYSEDRDDAEQLKTEATAILKANSKQTVAPKEYAMAIYRLEKAQSILETSGEADGSLAEEVNSGLFWARKCSNVHIIKELEKIHAENPPLKLASHEKKKRKAAEDGDGPPDAIDTQAEAKDAFEAAQNFATSHASDDYAVSLRYFQMANEYPGTDYAIKAMTLARDAQIRFAINNGSVKEDLPDTPEMKPIHDADLLVSENKIEQSFELYKQSFKLKDNIISHRRLGLAYYRRAQQMMDEVIPKLEALKEEYTQAYAGAWVAVGSSRSTPKVFNPNNPGWVAVKKKHQDLTAETNQATMRYLYAQWEFEKVLKMAPNNRDFDSAAYIGVCLSARPDTKSRAKGYLDTFMKSYEPANDIERFIYEYCKSEHDRVSAK